MELKVVGNVELKIKTIGKTGEVPYVEFEASFVHDGERIPLRNHGLRTLTESGTLTINNVETTLIVTEASIKESDAQMSALRS